jgi:LUD domain
MTLSKFNQIPSDEIISKTSKALESHGMTVHIAENGLAAKAKVLEILPKGAEVMDMTSMTLEAIGLADVIQNSKDYRSARKESYALDQVKQSKAIHNLRSIPDWTIGSVHAVTEEGSVMVASQSGSQLAGYSFGADHVIWVIGAQKIVKNLDEGFKRLYEHSLVLESERARKAYGVPASAINKIFILHEEIKKGRITVILVKEKLGF